MAGLLAFSENSQLLALTVLPADPLHTSAGRLECGGADGVFFRFRADGRVKKINQGSFIVAIAQNGFQINLLIAEQAATDSPVGSDPEAVALRAEVPGNCRN